MSRAEKIVIGFGVVWGLIQLAQCERTNARVTSDVNAPPEVASLLRRACYDCHSNETVWPWYSRVAPFSWLVHQDVVEGRAHLNFSEWDKVPVARRAKELTRIGREVGSGDMPPWFYLPMHRAARLSDADKARLQQWASSGS